MPRFNLTLQTSMAALKNQCRDNGNDHSLHEQTCLDMQCCVHLHLLCSLCMYTITILGKRIWWVEKVWTSLLFHTYHALTRQSSKHQIIVDAGIQLCEVAFSTELTNGMSVGIYKLCHDKKSIPGDVAPPERAKADWGTYALSATCLRMSLILAGPSVCVLLQICIAKFDEITSYSCSTYRLILRTSFWYI